MYDSLVKTKDLGRDELEKQLHETTIINAGYEIKKKDNQNTVDMADNTEEDLCKVAVFKQNYRTVEFIDYSKSEEYNHNRFMTIACNCVLDQCNIEEKKDTLIQEYFLYILRLQNGNLISVESTTWANLLEKIRRNMELALDTTLFQNVLLHNQIKFYLDRGYKTMAEANDDDIFKCLKDGIKMFQDTMAKAIRLISYFTHDIASYLIHKYYVMHNLITFEDLKISGKILRNESKIWDKDSCVNDGTLIKCLNEATPIQIGNLINYNKYKENSKRNKKGLTITAMDNQAAANEHDTYKEDVLIKKEEVLRKEKERKSRFDNLHENNMQRVITDNGTGPILPHQRKNTKPPDKVIFYTTVYY